MCRNGLCALLLVLFSSLSTRADAALIVDARVDGVARYCVSAGNFSFRPTGATTWRCGPSTYVCWATPVHVLYPDDNLVYVDCTTTRPPWATDPLPSLIFGSGFE